MGTEPPFPLVQRAPLVWSWVISRDWGGPTTPVAGTGVLVTHFECRQRIPSAIILPPSPDGRIAGPQAGAVTAVRPFPATAKRPGPTFVRAATLLTNRLGALHPQNTGDTGTHASRGNRLEMSQNPSRIKTSGVSERVGVQAMVCERGLAAAVDVHAGEMCTPSAPDHRPVLATERRSGSGLRRDLHRRQPERTNPRTCGSLRPVLALQAGRFRVRSTRPSRRFA